LAFGEVGFSAAIIFFAVAAFLQNTVGLRKLPGAGALGAWKSPVLVASLAAVGCRVLGVPLPHWLLDSVSLLGSLTVPLMLISLGYSLASIPASGLRTGSVLAVLRLTIGPVAAVAVA